MQRSFQQRPASASSRRGLNSRESVGNPLNLSLRRSPSFAPDGAAMLPLGAAPRPTFDTGIFGASRASGGASRAPEQLRFFAYFDEPILEYTQKSVPYENPRVRKCLVTFYPMDSTVGVDEPRLQNSGYMQGKLLKRSKVSGPGGGALQVADFYVGAEVEIFGKKFVIVDADTRTRKYYEVDVGSPLGVALEYPDDGFEASRSRASVRSQLHRADLTAQPGKFSRPSSAPAARSSKHSTGNMSTGIYVEAGHEVLRFFCAYQDERPGGDRRRYTLHYFLADDTLEVKEVHTEGVDHFPNLLRRARLPKDAIWNPDDPLADKKDLAYVTWRDLACGSTVRVWCRTLLVVSCDAATEAWYRDRGMAQHALQVAPDSRDMFPETIPPYNGYGAENDLYSMGLSLQPGVIKSTQEDYNRFVTADNKVLRFECTLAGAAVGVDREKVFVVNYNLGDDTISVFEPPIRNSGCNGGVFLQRTRYKKHIPDHRPSSAPRQQRTGSVLSRWLRPSDFHVGAEVAFEEPSTGRLLQTFRVVRQDGYTTSVTAAKAHSSSSRIAQALERLAERLCAARVQVRSTLSDLEDSFGPRRTLGEATFRNAVRDMERRANSMSAHGHVDLDAALMDEICFKFADHTPGPARIRYDEFVDELVIAAPAPQVPERQASSTVTVSQKHLEKALVRALRHPMNRGNAGLRASFRAEDARNTGAVDTDAFFRVLRKHRIHGILSLEDASALQQRYAEPSALSAGIEYERLCDKAFEGNFEDYMAALLMVLPERGDLAAVDVAEFRASLRSGNAQPTMRTYLDRVNGAARDCDGDVQRKLAACMVAFASAFGRNHRKKMLRKHLMAFDTHNTGTVTRDEFEASAQQIIAENFCELDQRDLKLLTMHVFPNAWTRQPFDALLGILVSRDVKGVMRIHNAAMEQLEDPRFQFAAKRGR
ncbi:hypothetical protein M885DRAFT_540461 [Pelagophyceae sp. CCMP2097]|nr:hypothetical protein M885DRAFT_540461 [Pelagophyceae sp. CCMP2097]